MNWTMALWGLGAIALYGVSLWGLAQALPPLLAYCVANTGYGAVLAFAIFQGTSAEDRHVLVDYVTPPRWLTALAALPVIVMAVIAMVVNDVVIPAPLYLFIAMGALAQALVSEFFWRGALLPQPDRSAIRMAFFLSTAAYLPLVFVPQLAMAGGPLLAILGAMLVNALALALRLRTGTLAAGIAMQVALNLFILTDLTGRNLALG